MKKTHIVGGAGSACFHAMTDALGTVLNAIDEGHRSQTLRAAIETFQITLDREVELSTDNNKRHLGLLLRALEGLVPATELKGKSVKCEPEVDVEALIASSINDIDLNDENLFTKGEVETFLSKAGDEIAQRYAHSGKAFHLERVDTPFKGTSYLAIGTSSGPHPRFPGQDFNVFCTTGGCRTIKEADSDLVVHFGGRQLTRGFDAEGRSYFIRFVPLSSEHSWRFWASTNKDGNRRDVDALKFVIKLNANNAKGYDVTRRKGQASAPAQAQAN